MHHLSQAFVDNLIEDEELCAEQKDEFKVSVWAVTQFVSLSPYIFLLIIFPQEFVKEQVRAAKKARREVKIVTLAERMHVCEGSYITFVC